MSYSISARGATIAAALAAIGVAFDQQVVASQPIHARDRDAALGCAEAMSKQLGECPAGYEVAVSLSGSLGWTGTAGGTGADSPDFNITAASTQASVYFTTPPAASA